ncbi:c-type cytochrome [Ancylobacter sp. Lp-2]|uniref:cytochrome-c peroxidase n=1 Tax=Ancylobacter sp. Lp-2 TaxID=2881339 RepID=UPI001E30F379|nr:cytochrome c peroxidase [Ancylobacter sp. Lp-2]MCB4769729.1 c-type cytochrome [Ancylobacter sp. Lp-2]
MTRRFMSPAPAGRGRAWVLLAVALPAAVLGFVPGSRAVSGTTAVPANRQPFTSLQVPGNLDPKKVALGERLFADPILSSQQRLSCASCHDLAHGGANPMKRTVGYEGRTHRFNAPTIFNVGNNYRLGWRGGFTSLEEQNENVLLDPNLMAATWPMVLSRLEASPTYALMFAGAFGRPPDRAAVLDALATYQRSLVTPNSAFDRYLAGDRSALGDDALRGYQLFRDYGCAACHQGSNLGGNMFQKFGIYAPPPRADPDNDGDLGRFTLTGKEEDKGVFRVPSLRNVAVTAPYFHDGRAPTLPDAIAIMGASQLGRRLSPADIHSLVAFLETLTGEYNGRTLEAQPALDDH